jgi:hypothetical protein
MNGTNRLAVAAVVAVVGLTGSANGQFQVRYGFGLNYGGFPGVYPGWNTTIGFSLGGVGAPYHYRFSLNNYPTGSNVFSAFPGPGASSYGGVGVGSGYFAGEGSRIVDQQRAAIARAQRNAQWDRGVNATPDFDRWLNDQTKSRRTTDPNEVPKLNPALLNPPDQLILDGGVLNELAALVTDLEAKGKKAEPGLCAPDLMTKVMFDGGAAADAANLFRHTELTFPEPLRAAGYATLRTNMEKAYTPVAAAAAAGKRVSAADADRLLKEVASARQAAGDLVKDGCVGDAKSVCGFFNRLEAAAKFAKDPAATGVAGTKWAVLGATVADLVKHVNKHKLKFGKAADGDEAAYFSLHRGLLAYYAGLTQAK